MKNVQLEMAITKIERRISELQNFDVYSLSNETGSAVLISFVNKINATLREIFGSDSIEYEENKVVSLYPTFKKDFLDVNANKLSNHLPAAKAQIDRQVLRLCSLVSILKERLELSEEDVSGRTLRAYEGLELHPEISRRASKLYRDGHYANAVEAAVKALNGLVRLRSDLEIDGSKLMEAAFNPKTPVLKFNDLSDQSDQDEQRGFMMLFSGAVAGLRNPRAHGFINDDPERALEFIAFISLLAKLLDQARE